MPNSAKCSNCGFASPAGMRFCGNCGARLANLDPAKVDSYPAARFSSMMGADLMDRFRHAGLEAAGQRRNVTVLFVDISGYTSLSRKIEAEDLYLFVRQYIKRLANDVYKYDGIVDKFTGDGLMALFGAPIAQENDAELALRAALDMQADVFRLSQQIKEIIGGELQVRIGLHSGSVIVGGIGSDLLMNYTAIGDTVNLAQRLEEVADPGTILVSVAVYQQTRTLFDFIAIPDLALKGITQHATCYRALRPKKRPDVLRGIEGLRAPMIGRENELRQLLSAIHNLAHLQQGRFILILGEAGIGKSRLITELKTVTLPLNVDFLEGHSLTYRRSVSYWIFQDLLRNYLYLTGEVPPAQVSEKLSRNANLALGRRADEAIPYLEYLLGVPPSDAPAARRIEFLDAGQLRQQIFLAVRNLLVAEAERHPLILILEDLHWADDASLDMLHFLIEAIPQAALLVLAISRPIQSGKLEEIIHWAGEHLTDNFQAIHLHSLTPEQSMHLLSQLLSRAELPEALWKEMINKSAGIPFFLEEILRMLIDAGIIQRDERGWKLIAQNEILSLGVPDTLQNLILARFDHLEPFQRRILQVACVIGRQFNLQVLRWVMHPVDESEIRNALARLVEREFIQPLPDATATEFIFHHVIISDAIYSTLLRRERADLHGQVGEAIEVLFADRLDGQIDLLARHFSWSMRKDRALHYLILAGQKAGRSYLNQQARQYFEDARALLPEVDASIQQILQIYLGLGDVCLLVGEYDRARESYQNAQQRLALEEANLYLEERAAIYRKIGTTYERQGDYDQSLRCLRAAESALGDADLPVEKSQVLSEIGWFYLSRGNTTEAEQSLLRALQYAGRTNRYDITASIYNHLGGVYFQLDQLDLASSYFQKSLALRDVIGDVVAVARSYNNLGQLCWRSGKWENAFEYYQRSYELHTHLGDVEGMLELHSNLGILLIDRGNLDEALEHFQESLAISRKIGHRHQEALTYLHLSHLYLEKEEWQTGLESANRGLGILNEIGDVDHQLEAWVYIGQAWLGNNDLDQAQRAGEQALGIFEQVDRHPYSAYIENRGRALLLLGKIASARKDLELAQHLLDEANGIFQVTRNQLERGHTTLALAQLAAMCADMTGARALTNEARLIYSQLGANAYLRRLELFNEQLTL